MSRFQAALVVGLLALSMTLPSGQDALAALVWDRVSLPGANAVLTAVVIDPDDPRTLWVAGSGNVWVSDDEGDTWNLVGVIGSRAQGARQSDAADTDDEEDEEDTRDEDDEPRTSADDNDATELDPEGNPVVEEDETPTSSGRTIRLGTTRADPTRRQKARIHRLRVLRDLVYICADQGLFTIARRARSLGGLREVRLGQSTPVHDVALHQGGKQLWVATPFGLLSGGAGYPLVPVFGPLGSRRVNALVNTVDGLFVAGHQGLWRKVDANFVNMGLVPGRLPLEDLVAPAPTSKTIIAISPSKVFTIDRIEKRLVSARTLPGMKRGAWDRSGRLWVSGRNGVWVGGAIEGLLTPRNQGLATREVHAVAAPPSGTVHLWAVGSFGLARLVSEEQRIWNAQARALATSREGMPTAWDVVEATYRSKRIDLSTVGTEQTLIRFAWLLPDLFMRYERVLERDEDRVFVPPLAREVLDQVRVVPFEENLQVQFVWDLSPLVFWAPEAWTPPPQARSDVPVANIDTTPSMAIRRWIHWAVQERRRTNKRVIPVYNEWVNARVRSVGRPATSLKQAIREELRLQHLEADLFAYTNGWFQPKATSSVKTHSTKPPR